MRAMIILSLILSAVAAQASKAPASMASSSKPVCANSKNNMTLYSHKTNPKPVAEAKPAKVTKESKDAERL
jgi:hypothetical protein